MPESGAPPLSSPALSGALVVVDAVLSVVVVVWLDSPPVESGLVVCEAPLAGVVDVVFSSSLPQAPSAIAAAAAEIAIARLMAPMIADPAARHGNFARKLRACCRVPASVRSGRIRRVIRPPVAAAEHSRRNA
jgi:hypothetical protein